MNKLVLLAFLTISFLSVCLNAFCQIQTDSEIKDLQGRVETLERSINALKLQLKSQNSIFSKQLSEARDSIKVIRSELDKNTERISSVGAELGIKISESEKTAGQKIQVIDNTVSKNTLYWTVAVLLIAFLSVLLFAILRKQLSKDKSSITENIRQTKKSLEEEGVKLDSKLVDLLATQLQLIKEEVKTESQSKSEIADHELALKVADEIVRIQKNLGNMDSETKGLKQLAASIKRIQENFQANGYELIDMFNKPYDQGMKVSANFRTDESLKPGEQIITRIIKPQVNFNGIMIQAAQVEVSVGE